MCSTSISESGPNSKMVIVTYETGNIQNTAELPDLLQIHIQEVFRTLVLVLQAFLVNLDMLFHQDSNAVDHFHPCFELWAVFLHIVRAKNVQKDATVPPGLNGFIEQIDNVM